MPSKPRLVDLRGGRGVPPPEPRDVRREPRRSPLRLRRQRLRAVVTAAVCVCTLLTAYALHVASYMDRFTFQHVAVSGATEVSAPALQKFVEERLGASSVGFISGRNIFVYDYAPLAQEIIQNFPRIKSAQVTRDTTLGNGLVVMIEERSAYALWCSGSISSDCYALDESGVVFAASDISATSSLPSPYVFRGTLSSSTVEVAQPPFGGVFTLGKFADLSKLLQVLRDTGVHPTGANLKDASDLEIPLAEGYFLKISLEGDIWVIPKNLALVLSSDALREKKDRLEYVDLRFGNRVYYRFEGEAETE